MTITGTVIEGAKRGKALGYPTANILFAQELEDGIYISRTKIGDITFASITFVGAALTYNEKDRKAETYIFDFDENLYGKEITVELLPKIRDNQKFESEGALIAQMDNDIQVAKEYFASTS
jgi:riboflavin kinase / FMN adenylyltransferase